MHARHIVALLALALTAMSAAIPVPNPGVVRKSEASPDDVDITQVGDGY